MNVLYDMVDEGISILQNINIPINEFGQLMHEAWNIKRSLSDKVTNLEIDKIYESAMSAGASGGKVLGAGGGGFMLFFVKPENQQKVKENLKNLVHVPFKFENLGSSMMFNGK